MKTKLCVLLLLCSNLIFANDLVFKGTRTDAEEKLNCEISKSVEYGEEYISFNIEATKREKRYYTFFNNLGFYKFGPFPIGTLSRALRGNQKEVTSLNELKFHQVISGENDFFGSNYNVYLAGYLENITKENEKNLADSNIIHFTLSNGKIIEAELTQSIQEFIFRGPNKYHRSFCKPN